VYLMSEEFISWNHFRSPQQRICLYSESIR
jgi:hypothetical protein